MFCAIESGAPNALQLGTLCKGDRCKSVAIDESAVANAEYRGRDEYAGNIDGVESDPNAEYPMAVTV